MPLTLFTRRASSRKVSAIYFALKGSPGMMTVLAKSPLFAVLCAVDILTLLSISGRIKTLGELDNLLVPSLSQPRDMNLSASSRLLDACAFIFTLLPICSEKSFYIIEKLRRPSRSRFSRSLYIVGTGARDYIAHCYLLVLGKQAGFDNDLQDFSRTRLEPPLSHFRHRRYCRT